MFHYITLDILFSVSAIYEVLRISNIEGPAVILNFCNITVFSFRDFYNSSAISFHAYLSCGVEVPQIHAIPQQHT